MAKDVLGLVKFYKSKKKSTTIPPAGWLGVRGFKDSRVQGVVKKSTMPLLASLTPGPLES